MTWSTCPTFFWWFVMAEILSCHHKLSGDPAAYIARNRFQWLDVFLISLQKTLRPGRNRNIYTSFEGKETFLIDMIPNNNRSGSNGEWDSPGARHRNNSISQISRLSLRKYPCRLGCFLSSSLRCIFDLSERMTGKFKAIRFWYVLSCRTRQIMSCSTATTIKLSCVEPLSSQNRTRYLVIFMVEIMYF